MSQGQGVRVPVPVRVRWWHVVGVVGVNPRNKWIRLDSGLYDLAGSSYAFDDGQVQECFEGGGRCNCVLLALMSRDEVSRLERRVRVFGGRRYVFVRITWVDGSVSVRAYREGAGEPFREWTGCGMSTDPAYLGV